MEDLRITFVQTSLTWENTRANLDAFTQKLAGIAPGSTDLIILPEMFSTGFSMKPEAVADKPGGEAFIWMRQMAKEKACVITGSVAVTEKGRFFNRLFWVRPDGSFETYDKKHLFRYAGEHAHYTAGNSILTADLKGWKIRPLICYDLRFPVWSRNRWDTDASGMRASYDLLIYVANWPERRSYPWKSLLVARAIENLSYVAGVNRIGDDGHGIAHSGDSAVLNMRGEIISKTPPHTEAAETVILSAKELDEFRKAFPAGLDADDFQIL